MTTYAPSGHGKDKSLESVNFVERMPPEHLSGIVHRYIFLKSEGVLHRDYRFHALPDACTYLVFDQSNPEVTGITSLSHTSEEFNLGKEFNFVNIRFFPGVWTVDKSRISRGQITDPYTDELPFIEYSRRIADKDPETQCLILSELVELLVRRRVLAINTVLHRVLSNLDRINSVKDMANCVGVSSRHLQRLVQQSIGFSPHDLLKVLRLQKALREGSTDQYADQSHYINSFRRATGYTPGKYTKEFDV